MSYDLIIFISHQPLLNLNTGRWLVHPCRCCNESINWFFWSLIKCLNAYLSSSSAIFLSFYNFASLFLKLPRLLKTLKMVCSHFLFFLSRNFDHISFVFFSVDISKLTTNTIMRDWWALSHKSFGSSCKLDEIETYMGSCLPIQFCFCCF